MWWAWVAREVQPFRRSVHLPPLLTWFASSTSARTLRQALVDPLAQALLTGRVVLFGLCCLYSLPYCQVFSLLPRVDGSDDRGDGTDRRTRAHTIRLRLLSSDDPERGRGRQDRRYNPLQRRTALTGHLGRPGAS